MAPTPESSSRLLEEILARAARDGTFRRRLLTEPAPAIREAFGVQVPPGFQLRFVEKGPDEALVVVLPDEVGGDELSDDELEDVAGGNGTNPDGTWEI